MGVALNHNSISKNIFDIFERYDGDRKCQIFGSDISVHLTQEDKVIPDVFPIRNPDVVKDKDVVGVPDLVVEVLCRKTRMYDRGFKYHLYERCGVKEYWLVTSHGYYSIEVFLLEDGKYRLDEIYELFEQYEIDDMTDEERAELVYEFKTHLYDDLIIDIRDVFKGID